MSLIHSTIVGHFDPTKLTGPNRPILRDLDLAAAKALLAQYPANVAEHVEFHDGYAECWWADRSFRILDTVYEYAYRLASEQGCIAAETPVCYISFPEEAKQTQAMALRTLSTNHRTDEAERPMSPVRLVVPDRESAPCPFCGEPLRTLLAKQCRFCKMDWQRCRELGITAVPTFVVGKQGVVGAQPYEALESLVVKGGAAKR